MSNPRDVRPVGVELYFLPVTTRMPLKFGAETVEYVTCARCRVTVQGRNGRIVSGWGETPLSVTWVWPSSLSYDTRHQALRSFCQRLARAWGEYGAWGHPLELGTDFVSEQLDHLRRIQDQEEPTSEPIPWLAALVCCSLFDIALHDAYGNLHDCDIYTTYGSDWMSRSLDAFLTSSRTGVSFRRRFASEFLVAKPPQRLLAWHLVGGADPLTADDLTGNEPDDGYPVLLADWIKRDGLQCLKIKLRGNDPDWDYQRLLRTGEIAIAGNAHWLTADFNCLVTEPEYVNELLDRLCQEHPRLYGMLLYVEQPFPYDLVQHQIDVRSVSARKPLFMDESAHDWQHVELGQSLGWTGVALKTCKTQSGAILSACWAKAHGMTLMVQDLTNPMLAQIPHLRLAAHVGTIMGVETNSMQFYPEVSLPEAKIHPGCFTRRLGYVDLSSLRGSGFGYRWDQIDRILPEPVVSIGESI